MATLPYLWQPIFFLHLSSRAKRGSRFSLPSHHLPVRRHVLVVLFQTVGEAVMTISIADKIEIVSVRRVHCRLNRNFAGVADGTRRKSRMRISIVGRLELHIGMMKRAAVASL